MSSIFKNKSLTPLIHLLVWGVLFSLPYIASSGQSVEITRFIEHFWIPLVLYAVVFYLNYFALVDWFLFPKKPVLFFVLNALIIALFIWVRYIVRVYIFPEMEMGPPGQKRPPISFFIYIDGLSFIIPVIFSVTLKVFERWIKTEAEKKEAENARLQSELQHLKYQLQPHFFFNSLNNIYALVDISPDKAKETILALSKLMRYLLYESNTAKVSFKKEVEFMQKYIELMQLRTAGNTIIKTNFMPLPADVEVAPLLFIPLLENAFKHGVSATQQSEMVFTMKMEGTTIVFETSNLNLPKNKSDRSGSGIGLQNIKKRLQLIYPGRYEFTAAAEGTRFNTRLEIDIKD